MATYLSTQVNKLLLVLLLACLAAAVPSFTGPSSRTVYIDENPSSGSYVLTVHASDPDGGAFTFSLASSTTPFSINSNTGVVTVSVPSQVDRETNPNGIVFTVNLLSAASAVVSTLQVTVRLNDINDNSPSWDNPVTNSISLSDATTIGTVVYSLVVSDADLGANGDVRYRIITPTDGTFSVNALTGVISLARSLDFDTTPSYNVHIIAEDQGSVPLSTNIMFTISVSSAAATIPAPNFVQTHYSVTVDEGVYSTTAANLVTVTARDLTNPTATIQYRQITRGDATDLLFMVSTAGAVSAVGVLDRETVDFYMINVAAFVADASGNPTSRSATATVAVTIEDINDNSPVLENPHPNAIELLETQPVGVVIYSPIISDADSGTNGDVSFQLVSPTNGPLVVNQLTGVITLARVLDYDVARSYVLSILVQDKGVPQRSTTISLTVNVLDVLDPPPHFTQSTYSVEVAEDTYVMNPLINVVAIDTLHPDALINYRQVVRGDVTDTLFHVNNANQSNPGRVTVTGTLDREMESTYTINIEAWRTNAAGEVRSAVSLVSVVFTVLDVNDNTPTLVNTIPSTVTIQENDPIGTIVYSLVVRDPDEGSNGEVAFTLVSPSDGTFAVSSLGVVTLRRALNAAVTSSYTVLITVSDRGSSARQFTDTRTVTVMPTVVVIPGPSFGQLVYHVSQPEGDYSTEQAGAHLTTVSATTATPNAVRYTQQTRSDLTDSLFAVNSATGAVSVEGILDREMTRTHVITIEASVVDAMGNSVTNSLTSTTTVVVTVTDVNDNPPTFFIDSFVGSVLESAQIGNIAVAGVRAFDRDAGNNSVFSFGFADTASTVPFTIDAATGVITVSGSLDYETTQQYPFMIKAQETRTTSRLQSQASVTINVINENDNLPTFTSASYTFELAENVAPQALTSTNPAGLTMIQAMDRDLGVFGQITYLLLGSGVGTLFSVASATGQISTLAMLDREARGEYHLILVGQDGTSGGSTPHRATTSVIISVTDVNDNPPILTPTSHTAFLTEGETYTNFLFVHAVDADPAGPNSRIQYSIAFSNGTASSQFTIDATSGGVSATGLNYEQATSHSLTITASDAGSPPMTSTASLQVTVTPVNELAPVFSMASYTTTILESLAVGSAIGVTVSATDPEPGHSVTYFSVSSDPHSAFFHVGQSSGIITLAHSVDADAPNSHSSFSFRVIAVDNAAPPQTGTATIAVTVTNVNDNDPVITNPPANDPGALAYSIAEGAGTPIPRPLLTVAASDLDGDTITYAINPTSTFFTVDSSTGDVVQIAMLNYETSTQHSLTITACDPAANCDQVTLTISVTDYNDNPPAFSSTTFTVSMSECDIEDGTLLATVTATDLVDTGNFANIVYSIVAGDTARFDLNTATGEIRAAAGQNWDFETQTNTYVLEVRATDNPTGTPRLNSPSDAMLTVTITDCNDNPPVLSPSGYAFTIPERTAGPTANEDVFSGISATDTDASASNRATSYSVVGGVASTNNWFDVTSTTGAIFLRSGAVLDREDPAVLINSLGQGVMSFDILVTNTASSATLTDTATVTVTITDINDHSPVFEQSDPVSLTVIEHSQPPGSFLTDISATDADYGSNAHIRYSITAGNDDNEFAIDPDSGVMTVIGDLDQEQISMYTLTVQAANDMATGATPTTITVIIDIQESNDHNPIFTMQQYTDEVTEYDSIRDVNGVAPGAAVGLVSATDQDGSSSPAGQVEYEIISGHMLGSEQIFNISDPDSGVIVVLRPDLIDHETNSQFDLVVVAHDLVVPENQRRQGTAHYILTVRDVNDNRPVFVDLEYFGVVAEEQPVGTTATLNSTITARDADQGGSSTLTYSLVSGSPFSLSSDGRTLVTTDRLDRETTASYMVMINVQDSGGYSTVARLYIQVADVNDNRPCFTQSSADLATSLPENVPVFPNPMSMIVQTVTATDVDLDSTIMYYIGGGARGDFDVDRITGEVRVIDPLDSEDIDQYNLNITATDGLLTCSVTFTVNIDAVNDNNPVFDEPVFSATLAENAAIGTTVPGLRVTATDLDPESEVEFETVPGTSSSFVVTQDGFVVTNATLDREIRNMHTFRVRATDGFFFTLEDAFVEITLSDVNDEFPIFEEELYEVDVQELTPANAIIVIVHAEDADEGTNAEIRYSISAVNPPSSSGLFSINPINGAIAPTAQVDISTGDATSINLTVTATDQGPFAQTGTTTVAFSLVDRNLNAPVFNPPHYNFSIVENSLGATIGIVLAREPNGDLNTVITYGVVLNTGDGGSLFAINSATGEISTAASLDRETRDVYTITVLARDNAATPKTGYASVTVHVLDDNDHLPVFDPADYPIAISESTSVGSTILRVLASDNDIGTNAMLSYNITTGNSSAFVIDSSGVITSQVVLDRESVSSYTLVVTATDGAAQPRSATANVIISINDENDNSPRFTSGAVLSATPQNVPEDVEPLTLITTVQADDPDFQLNGIVIYAFDNLTMTKGPFQIDHESGEIRVRSGMEGRLDRETVSSYDLTVIASDQRGKGPQVRSTVGTFRINLEDVNDNIPTFTMPLYEFNLREDFYREDPGAESPQPMFGKVMGVDRDIDENAISYYHTIGDSNTNTTCVNQFCVGIDTGNLILIGSLDREAQSTYIFTVAVSNNRILEFNETTGAPEGASTASVSVTVTDFNDETPEFVESSLSSSVAEEAPFGTTVTTLRATDADIGNNSIVYYRILSNNVPYVVDRDSGVVTTAGVFAGLSGTIHSVQVEAYDNFGIPPTNRRSSMMNVRIYKLSDQVILTFKTEKDLVEGKIDRLQSALEELLGENVVITEVRVEQTDDGSVDTTGTDVLFFAVRSVTGEVINPETIIRLIDARYSVVQEIFDQCSIQQVQVFRPPVPTRTTIPYWVWVILGVMILIIACLCCCFLIGCVIERRRNRRWLRKAPTMHKSNTSELEQFSMYNYQSQANPAYAAASIDWEATMSDVTSVSTIDQPNPLYASMEIEVEMPPEPSDYDIETSSRRSFASQEVDIELPPEPSDYDIETSSRLSSESQEFKMEYNEDAVSLEGPGSSTSLDNLVKASRKRKTGRNTRYSDYGTDEDMLARAIQDTDEDDDQESKTSYI